MTTSNIKIDNLFFLNKNLIAKRDNTCILCDPSIETFEKFFISQNIFEFQAVIITQLSKDNLHLLYSASPKIVFYMSQELFLLLQKMQRFNLIPVILNMGKIIPYGFPQKIGSFKVTAYKNDDSLYGSLALIISDIQTKITVGYVNIFALYGGHKKRARQWLKKMAASNMKAFITSKAMFNNKPAQLPTSENGIQKNFCKQLQNKQSAKPFSVFLSPWNPERLHRFYETCTALDKKLVLPAAMAELLHFFFPEDTVYYYATAEVAQQLSPQSGFCGINKQQLAEHPNDFVLQDSFEPCFIDPSIQSDHGFQNHSWLDESNFRHAVEQLDEKMLADLKSRSNTTNILQC